MKILAKTPNGNAIYQCDACDHQAPWKGDGLAWSRYGPMEGDGIDLCSDGCRACIADIDTAFNQLFDMVDDGLHGPDPVRKEGVRFDRKRGGFYKYANGKPTPWVGDGEEQSGYTTSSGDTIGCPHCGGILKVAVGEVRCKCKRVVRIEVSEWTATLVRRSTKEAP
jgi:phage FluMu protein Com